MKYIISFLIKHTYFFNLFLVVASILVSVVPVARMNSKAIEITTLESTKLYTNFLQEFRTLYSEEVISKLERPELGINISHDFKGKANTIPLPASLTIMLGNIISEDSSQITAKLYSPYPFPNRLIEGGLSDSFAKEAWEYFKKNPDDPFYRIVDINDEQVLRYAIADKMRPSCVHCHNTHPQTPKNNWKEGDVRGVLELNRPLSIAKAKTSTNLYSTIGFILAMMTLFTMILFALIARLKKANKFKRNLIKEVHHRVKNNLQVVNSLLRLQSHEVKDEKVVVMFEEVQNRVLSMALLHQKMYESDDLQHIDIHEHFTLLIKDLVNNYDIGKEIELDVNVKEVDIGIKTLVPLGLIINEIITNSLKYAFNNRNEGKIVVHIKPLEDEKYEMIIGDDGVGLDEEKKSEGFGTELVGIFVEQLEGTIERLDQTGTVFKIIFEKIDKE